MDKRKNKMEQAGKSIPDILAQNHLLEPMKLHQAKLDWAAIAGDQIAQYSFIQAFQGRTAIIGVTNPVWMNHLFMYQQKIMDNLNAYLEKPIITALRFVRCGRKPLPVTYETTDGEEEGFYPKADLKSIVLPKDVAEAIRRDTEQLPEPLREKMRALRFAQARRTIAYEREGFHHCPRCGRWLRKGESVCSICRLELRHDRKKEIRRILEDMPWLTLDEMVGYGYLKKRTGQEKELYDEVRRDCIYALLERIRNHCDDLADDTALAFFITRRPPMDMTEGFIENLAAKYRRKFDVSTHRRQSDDRRAPHRGHLQGPSEKNE